MRVYISATAQDLVEHRLAVARTLRRMGHVVRGMEEYVAEARRPIERCLADVAACDAYLGIIAWRYGYVPKQAPQEVQLPAGVTLGKTSITEAEYRQAVESKRAVLVFLLDPDAAWPARHIDAVSSGAKQGQRIAAFREHVSREHVAGFFSDPEQLAALAGAAVYREEVGRGLNIGELRIDATLNAPFTRDTGLQDTTLFEIKNGIAAAADAHGLEIDLGHGATWWSTRLYLLASLADELTSVGSLVFVKHQRQYVGVSPPAIVRERLAHHYPQLKAYEDVLINRVREPDIQREVEQRVQLWETTMAQHGGKSNIQTFVTPAQLSAWLSPFMVTGTVQRDARLPTVLEMQRIVDWPSDFVPMTDDGRFVRMIDKSAMVEQVARWFIAEQVARLHTMTN